jgi:HK97 family phage prohead protease
MKNTKDFKFFMKAVADTGSFEGMAAVYGNVDLGGDVIEAGAFTRTIKNSGGKVPLLWQHDQREPIGMGILRDSKEGLMIQGKLVMESDVAQKALGLMKADVLTGLSIGYDTVVSEYDKAKDVRKLKELKLYEVSLVTFPMNPRAQVSSVKQACDNFAEFLEQIKSGEITRDIKSQLLIMRDQISALISSDSGNHFEESPAMKDASDSDLHSLMNSIKEFIQ